MQGFGTKMLLIYCATLPLSYSPCLHNITSDNFYSQLKKCKRPAKVNSNFVKAIIIFKLEVVNRGNIHEVITSRQEINSLLDTSSNSTKHLVDQKY